MTRAEELLKAFENCFMDVEGYFDATKDRERYIKLLESVIEQQQTTIDNLCAFKDLVEEQDEITFIAWRPNGS